MQQGTLSGLIIGKYQLRQFIGGGGMGDVYLAQHVDLERMVALKVLKSLYSQSQTEIGRFLSEARTEANLDHPHIVPVYDFGVEQGYHYLVMRLMHGGTLEDVLNKTRISLQELSKLLAPVASALDYAHSQGVIHRDVKPGNILFDQYRTPYIADFGIAKLVNNPRNLTSTNQIIGTPAFMAPELWRGEPTKASDIYALGVLAYQALTGQVPFPVDSMYKLMSAHLFEAPMPLHIANPEMPEVLDQVFNKVLAKEADERYPTASAFSAALDEVAQASQPVSISSPAPNDLRTPVFAATIGTEVPLKPERKGVHWRVAFLTTFVLILTVSAMWKTLAPQDPSAAQDVVSISTTTPTPRPIATLEPTPRAIRTTGTILTTTPLPNGPVTPAVIPNAGFLTSQNRSERWTYQWKAGGVYSICATSGDFDPTMRLDAPDRSYQENDDSHGTTMACIESYVAPQDGEYLVTISSVNRLSTGRYQLELTMYQDCGHSAPLGWITGIDQVNLREKPSIGAEVITQLLRNECFSIVGKNADSTWWKIRTPDMHTGWVINSGSVQTAGAIDQLPVLPE